MATSKIKNKTKTLSVKKVKTRKGTRKNNRASGILSFIADIWSFSTLIPL